MAIVFMDLERVRLSNHDLQAIITAFKNYFLESDHLWLFGSRVDLSRRGGDIDLYIETNAMTIKESLHMKSYFLMEVEQRIGEQKIDVVLNVISLKYDLPIYVIAKAEGIQLV